MQNLTAEELKKKREASVNLFNKRMRQYADISTRIDAFNSSLLKDAAQDYEDGLGASTVELPLVLRLNVDETRMKLRLRKEIEKIDNRLQSSISDRISLLKDCNEFLSSQHLPMQTLVNKRTKRLTLWDARVTRFTELKESSFGR